jgi:colanic acid/amylovoran biosynthesis glycosyltransferase
MSNNNVRYIFHSVFIIFFLSSSIIDCASPKKLMKILMVVAKFPKIHDICILNQITGLIDRGHDVWIYALSKGDTINVQEDVLKYKLIEKTIFYDLPLSLDDYDIVMFQLGHKLTDIRKSHHYKGKIVVCLRGYDITGFLQERPHAYDAYFDVCDLFMPVCEFFKTILIKEKCPKDKIVVHHSAIDCSRFQFKKKQLPRQGNINIVSAGRFVEKKGFAYSIRAVARLVKKFPQIKYTIIGDGILKNKYKKLINDLQVKENIKLDYWHTHDEYASILDKTHIFIAPSIVAQNNDQEGIPNVLKEAMAMGILVIATNHAGNPELIEDNVSGFLVEERNIAQIEQVVEYIVNNPGRWPSLQEAAVQKIKREFEQENENNKLEAILLDLLDA